MKISADLSKERNPVFKTANTFNLEPKVETSDYTTSYRWWRFKKNIIKLSYDDKELYCVASYQSSSNPITKKDFKKFIENKKIEFRSYDGLLPKIQGNRVLSSKLEKQQMQLCGLE